MARKGQKIAKQVVVGALGLCVISPTPRIIVSSETPSVWIWQGVIAPKEETREEQRAFVKLSLTYEIAAATTYYATTYLGSR